MLASKWMSARRESIYIECIVVALGSEDRYADSFLVLSEFVDQLQPVDILISELEPNAFTDRLVECGLILLSRYLVPIEMFEPASSLSAGAVWSARPERSELSMLIRKS